MVQIQFKRYKLNAFYVCPKGLYKDNDKLFIFLYKILLFCRIGPEISAYFVDKNERDV